MPSHHPVFGRLITVGGIISRLTGDVHDHVLPPQTRLAMPGLGPLLYIDIWPFGSPILVLASPDSASQVTRTQHLPKFRRLIEYVYSMTRRNDLLIMGG